MKPWNLLCGTCSSSCIGFGIIERRFPGVMCLFQIHNRDNNNDNNDNVDKTVAIGCLLSELKEGMRPMRRLLQFLLICTKNIKNAYGPLMFLVAGLQQQDQYA